jgi:signal transduction histidine kinase
MDAERIFLAELDVNSPYRLINYQEWTLPNIPALPEDIVQNYTQLFEGYQVPLQQGETIVIDDTSHLLINQDTASRSLQARRVESVVLSPLTIDQKVHGVLGCINLLASTETMPLNIRILELVAGMMKSLMQREYLIQSLEERIAERTRQLTTFLDMAMLSDQDKDLTDLLQPTLVSITQIADCDAAGIHIISETSRNLELVAQRGIPQQFVQSLHEIPVDDKFARWLAITDPYQPLGESAEGPVVPEPFCIPGFFAFYANRLSTGNKPFGLLSCYRIEDQPFSPFQTTLLNALSELIGIILENYRLRLEAKEFAAVEERQRLAREIHDAVSQSVYSLSLFARSAMDANDENNRDKLLSNLKDIEVTSLQAMREMRLLLYQLREVGKDEDIGAALDARFKQVENRLGIKGTFDIEEELFLPAKIRHEVWRIIIEALNNTVKHANASRVHVQLACTGEHIQFSVEDDGVGFNTALQSPGMGLKNILARAENLKAQLEILSKPGKGTKIELKIPMTCLDMEEEA